MPRLRWFVWLLAALTILPAAAAGENWPGWRGPRGDGTSRETGLPTTWHGARGENIAWKAPVAGYGHSSPIVWEDRIFLTSCQEDNGDRLLLCHDRVTGRERWRRVVTAAPLEKKHKLNSFASGTPAADGQQVYVTFLKPEFHSVTEVTPGELLAAAYTLDGEEVWRTTVGRFSSVHGFCSSPVLFENLVIINGDHDGDSYLAALDRRTGAVVWKVPRQHKTRSYVTPIIRDIGGRTQMILSGSKCVASYDPRTGQQHWQIAGPTEQFVASLVDSGDMLFLTAGFPERHILAIRPDAQGLVSEASIVWRTTRAAAYVPSPIAWGEYFICPADNGVVSCFDGPSGERHWMERLGKQYSASAVAAEGLVYLLDDDGVTKVVRPGATLEVVAENPLGENCYASPAISQGNLFVRSEQHLWCIGPAPTTRQ